MMGATKRGRVALKETVARNDASLRAMALASGRPVVSLTPPWHTEPKPRAPRVESNEPSEREIQAAILKFLRKHPNVAFVGRFNSGQALATDGNGKTRYTRFNTIKGFPDLHGMLKGGAAFYLEVKRASGRVTPEQRLFIDMVSAFGGIAAVVRSVDEVAQLVRAA